MTWRRRLFNAVPNPFAKQAWPYRLQRPRTLVSNILLSFIRQGASSRDILLIGIPQRIQPNSTLFLALSDISLREY
jgi:hypothetical protein